MFDIGVKILVSFVLTNWIYSEAILFYPPLEDATKTVYQTVRIPTHDQWPSFSEAKEAKKYATNVDSWFGSGQITSSIGDWARSFRRKTPSSVKAQSMRALVSAAPVPYLYGVDAFADAETTDAEYEVLFDDAMEYIEFAGS